MKLISEPSTPEAIAPLQKDYWLTLTAPQDAYWQEGLIAAADHFQIRLDDRQVGYFIENAQHQLMQFHLSAGYIARAPQIFRQLLEDRGIKTALAATIEPFYFSLCLDIQASAKVHTLLFSDHARSESVLPGVTGHRFRSATKDDLPQVLSLMTGGDEFIDLETVDAHFEGPLGYAKMVIEAGILHVLEKDGEILGTGEFRERADWVPFADVGMIVNKNYRRQGIGTYLLCLLKQIADQRCLQPICSCEAGNQGSQKAIENAGFIARHRVVEFAFEPSNPSKI